MEHAPLSETNNFETRSRALIDKFELTGVIPNIEKVIKTSREIAERYKVPESFLDDEVNLSLLLGCGQKLTESTDPLYRKRIEGLSQRLVARSAEKGTLDIEELWGLEPERAGLNEEGRKEYIKSKADPQATAEFIENHSTSITKAKEIWKAKGYDLDVKVTIVSDDVYEFRKKTRAAGFITVPDKNELSSTGGPVKIEFVLLKGYSDNDSVVKHEIYHIEDYWGFIRRGYQSTVLEGLDELHTENAVGNYKGDHSKDPFSNSCYFSLKTFWDKVSYNGDIDFNIIKDRQGAIETIAKNFGLDGLVDFTLMHAHGDGKFAIFETFYRDPERPIMDMLISKEKNNLRRSGGSKNLSDQGIEMVNFLRDFKRYCEPVADFWSPYYSSVYDLIPTKEGRVFSASPVEESGDSLDLPNESAKKAVLAYAKALAFAELYHRGEISNQPQLYEQIINTLGEIPHERTRPGYSVESDIRKEYERGKGYASSEDELYKDIYSHLYYRLVSDLSGIDFVFSLQNPTTREQMLKPFLNELDLLAKHTVETGNPNFMKWFVDGLYRYNMTSELRDISATYLIENYPELKPLTETKRTGFDARKISNFSF